MRLFLIIFVFIFGSLQLLAQAIDPTKKVIDSILTISKEIKFEILSMNELKKENRGRVYEEIKRKTGWKLPRIYRNSTRP